MGYYLLDHRNPHGDHFHRSRLDDIQIIVLHITAGSEDLNMRDMQDPSAENVAHYAATTDRQVSWHKGCDSNSVVELLPDSYTAFHVINYNSESLGLEISKTETTWSDEPMNWVRATITQAAKACKPWVRNHNIPLRRLSKSQVNAGAKGFVYHETLDPTRRSDPGDDFPLQMLFDFIRGEGSVDEEDDLNAITKDSKLHHIKNFQRTLNILMAKFTIRFVDPVSGNTYSTVVEDGSWGKRTEAAWEAVAEFSPKLAHSDPYKVTTHDWVEMRLMTRDL